jgi:hypothetical protein
MMQFYMLTLGILCVWRITHLLYAEDGPWDVVVQLRRAAGTGFWGKLLDCFYCTSMWVAAPFAIGLGQGLGEKLLLWFALSGGACLLQRITERTPEDEPAFYVEDEDKEEPDVLLRQKQDADSRKRSHA